MKRKQDFNDVRASMKISYRYIFEVPDREKTEIRADILFERMMTKLFSKFNHRGTYPQIQEAQKIPSKINKNNNASFKNSELGRF